MASGLSWRGLARELCIDIRLVKRWRNGARPDSANLIALFSLAAGMGLLHLLLPEAGGQETSHGQEDVGQSWRIMAPREDSHQ